MVKNADGRNWIEEDKHFEDALKTRVKILFLHTRDVILLLFLCGNFLNYENE